MVQNLIKEWMVIGLSGQFGLQLETWRLNMAEN